MEVENASGHGWSLVEKSHNKVSKLTAQELLFPENLSVQTLMIHLINRSIINKDENKSKIELITLFRQHISPRPKRNRRRNSCLNLCNINAGVKAVSLTENKKTSLEIKSRY